ncbi:helix-turn-helix transcriptional regulator [Sphingomonas oryzagri]
MREFPGQDVSGAETPGPILCKGTMLALNSAQAGVDAIAKTRNFGELHEVVTELTTGMEFYYYALGHHTRMFDGDQTTLRIHNYPKEWQESYDRQQLGICDPVHRASHRVPHGFRWGDTGSYVPMGERDHWMLAEARQHDIEDGWTIPANIPGEPSGSVTFATRIGQPFPEAMIFYANYLGGLAYQQARVIAGEINVPDKPIVTDRQIEVAKLVCQDMSDKEIAKLLDVSPCTVTKHIRDMSARLKVARRTALALRVVWAGYLCFPDVIPGGYQF